MISDGYNFFFMISDGYNLFFMISDGYSFVMAYLSHSLYSYG